MSDSQNLSPCKFNFNGALRRFLIARPAVWSDFELKLRNVYGLPASTAIDVQYKDDEGDVISLNTDSELEDVLAMHALFTQIAPVRFDVSLRDGEDLPALDNNITNTVAATANATAVDAVEPYNVAQTPQRERSNTVTSNHTSDDDGSLIEFEEALETTEPVAAASTESTLNQPISYPQNDLYEAALRQEQEMIETQKLQAPIFPGSVAASEDDTMDVEEVNNKDEDTNKSSSRRSSKSSSPSVVPVAEFEALRMDSATDVMDSIVASAIEQHAQDVAAAASVHSNSEDEDHADPAEPEIAEPEIPEPEAPHGDRALIEQFQMLIQEFQHVIQSNPQLVTIAGSIMNKIMSNVQVNVESFANYLQEAARHAQTSAEEAAASAHEAAAEATRSCPFGTGSENPFLSNPFFSHHRGGQSGRRGHEDPFSGYHDNAGDSSDRTHHPHGHHHGHHRGGRGGFGGRGGRGGCFGRGGGHQWSFGSLFPPTPPMPPMPSMPAMPPMPPMPPMPGMPPMPSMPSMPGMSHFFSSGNTSVPNTRPSPFSGGFPFHFGAPGGCKRGSNFHFRGDRPSACDTESGKEGSCEKKKRGSYSDKKDKKSSSSCDEAIVTPQQGESSSSATQQQQPQMTEIGNGWTWTQLPDDTTADPSGEASSQPKFGWVWNGGENGDAENPDPSPIYVASGDEEMAEPPQDGPAPFDFGRRGGRGGRGGFFRGGPRGGPRGGHPFAFFPHHPGHNGPHANAHGPHAHGPHGHGPHVHHGPEHAHFHAHHHQYPYHRHSRRHSGSKSAEEGGESQHESGSEERLKRRQTYHEQHRQAQEEHRKAHDEQRKAHEEQRKAHEEQRRAHEKQRKVQEEQRHVQEEQRRARVAAAATAGPIGGGSLAGIWPGAPATPTAPAVTAASAASASARPTSANAIPTSAAPISARPTTTTTTTTTTTPAAPQVSNSTLNPNDFHEEIRMLTNMGFADTAELRTVVRDFGGEVEAVVEFMISAGRL